MFVVFDSNVWISELGLNSAAASAARLFINKNCYKVLLPEVIKLEVFSNLQRLITKHVDSVRNSHNQLLTLFGEMNEIILPDEKQIKTTVEGLFSNANIDLVERPLTLESARSSFLKTIEKSPPSDKDQQFKDGVLWAECVSCLKEDDLILVTNDKAFYDNRVYTNGLAHNLKEEIKDCPYHLKILVSVGQLLEEIRSEIEIDLELLSFYFLKEYKDYATSILNELNLTSDFKLRNSVIKIFATENPREVYIKYTLMYNVVGNESLEEGLIELRLHGDGKYLTLNNEFLKLKTVGTTIVRILADGKEETIKNYINIAGLIPLGSIPSTIEHKIRLDLNM